MNKLAHHDLQFALTRCPKPLLSLMKETRWAGRIFVGGGFLRSVIAGEPVNDIDVFVPSQAEGKSLAQALTLEKNEKPGKDRFFESDNAYTITSLKPTVQIIHRWVFNSAAAVSDSFDFTCCCAAFWFDAGQTASVNGVSIEPGWRSVCDERFYPDLAAKRLTYRNPVRNEDAGGSALRVLKYYQKGYRIPLDSYAAVIARMLSGVKEIGSLSESELKKVLTGLLREVDPAIDPEHIAHLPAEEARKGNY